MGIEKITKIKEIIEGKGFGRMEGFEVVTTEQSIKLLIDNNMIDNNSQCCESWGFFWCNENPRDFIGATVRGVTLTDTALNEAEMKPNDLNPSDRWFEGGIMFVNIDTDKGVLQFVAYNRLPCYYGHNAKVECKQLRYNKIL